MTTTQDIEFSVTTDVPAGISSGMTFGTDYDRAAKFYAEASNGSYPKGTVVTFQVRQGEAYTDEAIHNTIMKAVI